MASLTSQAPTALAGRSPQDKAAAEKVVRDSVIVSLGGQLERALGTLTAVALRWGLDPARLGVYTGLRLYLDNTNRSSLGIGLGAVQEIPILRAAGREQEAALVANVAYTTNTITCFLYGLALVLLAWWRLPALANDPLAAEWTWGLVGVAGLVLIKRYESFLVAILRAHQEFALTAEMDIVESLASAAAVSAGLWFAGFWGLLTAVGVLLLAKIAYAHARHPLRFRWAWDSTIAWRLMRVGLPILANTAVFGAVLSIDRVLILWRLPHGAEAAGLYSIALIGTSWALDLAGRIVLVMYTAFQTTLGRTGDRSQVARQAMRATEAQAPVLLAGSAVAYIIGPAFLRLIMPRYAEGLPALRPLLPGMVLLGLAWPVRQALITVGRPVRLFLATTAGLLLAALAGAVGADKSGIVGVAWGMTVGYASVFAFTSASALVPDAGLRSWLRHLLTLMAWVGLFAAATVLTDRVAFGLGHELADAFCRLGLLALWLPPLGLFWARAHCWPVRLPGRLRDWAARV